MLAGSTRRSFSTYSPAVSWAGRCRTDFAFDALDMGLWEHQRAGQDVAGLFHHSDARVQGGSNRAIRHTERLEEADAVASVGKGGDSYDNAMAEAFNSLFKFECIRNPVMSPKRG